MRRKNSKYMPLLRRATVIVALCASLFGVVHFLLKHRIVVIQPLTVTAGISSDAWLGFFGNIIASVIAMLGIVITISYENKKERKIRRLEVQPILRLQCCELNEERQKCESSYSLDFVDVIGDDEDDDEVEEQTLPLPDIRIMNIGLNAASDVTLHFDMAACFSYSFDKLSVLKADKTERLSLDCNLPAAGPGAGADFQAVHVQQESPYGFPHAHILHATATLTRAGREADIGRMKTVYCAGGQILVEFRDIFGNFYQQSHEASLRVIELSDGSLLPYFSVSGAGESLSVT